MTIPKNKLGFDRRTPESAMALEAALARGDIILVVPLRDTETEQLVSGLLLEASALSVQLHDLGT